MNLIELSDEEIDLILGMIEKSVEYGYPISRIRKFMALYDKLDEKE